jgi:hypothetical protein
MKSAKLTANLDELETRRRTPRHDLLPRRRRIGIRGEEGGTEWEEDEAMTNNLFAELPAHLPAELFTTLLEAANVRIERIVSHSHASPEGFSGILIVASREK